MSKEKKIAVRVTEKVKNTVEKRWKGLGFRSEAEYVLALLKADNPSIDPARHIKGLEGGKGEH